MSRYASGNRGNYGRNNNNYGNARYNGGGGRYREKQYSGAKMFRNGDSSGITAWKLSKRAGMLTFIASFNGKHVKSKEGRNGKPYLTGIAVKIVNKDSLQESWTWGIWSEHGQTLTMDKVGMYITLRNGGFVGRIKR